MESQLTKIPPISGKVCIEYTLYYDINGKCDIRNFTTIVDKFLCDALQEYHVLPDDNYKICCKFIDTFGGIDKNNPRVEARITNVD